MIDYRPQPGDLLAFSGNGSTSLFIKAFTHWPWESPKFSHVGIVASAKREQLQALEDMSEMVNLPQERIDAWEERPLVFESTTLVDLRCSVTGKNIKGVQAHGPGERIARYDGQVYVCRLTLAYRLKLEQNGRLERLSTYLLSRIGDEYNGRGAALSGTHLTMRLRDYFWAWRKVDRSSLFCSQYVASALAPIDLFPITDASKWNPAALIKTLVKSGVYKLPELVKE